MDDVEKIRAMRDEFLIEQAQYGYDRTMGMRIAQDEEAMRFFVDYWDYVRWNEHGNEATLGDDVTFYDFVDMIAFPKETGTIDYLMPDGYAHADERAIGLAQRLGNLFKKYAQEE